jgi:hypothetical protein
MREVVERSSEQPTSRQPTPCSGARAQAPTGPSRIKRHEGEHKPRMGRGGMMVQAEKAMASHDERPRKNATRSPEQGMQRPRQPPRPKTKRRPSPKDHRAAIRVLIDKHKGQTTRQPRARPGGNEEPTPACDTPRPQRPMERTQPGRIRGEILFHSAAKATVDKVVALAVGGRPVRLQLARARSPVPGGRGPGE